MNIFIESSHRQAIQYYEQQKFSLAIECYVSLLKEFGCELLDKDVNKYILILKQLGKTYEMNQEHMKAITECYIKIVKMVTNDFITLNEIGICYFNMRNYKLAAHYFQKVLQIKQIADGYSNLATCYVNIKDFGKAEKALLDGYHFEKSNYKINTQLGQIYYYKQKYDQSIFFYQNISKKMIKDQDKDQLYNSAFPYLASQQFLKGFELYDNRLHENKINAQTQLKERVDIPTLDYWDGVKKCNRLLVVYEQGIGDNIQFFRFLIELSRKYKDMTITFFCKKAIGSMFIPYENIIVESENIIIPEYEYKLYSMSLPKILKLDKILPIEENYITIREDKLQYWKEALSPLKRYKVAFVFNGLLVGTFIEKFIPLQQFEEMSKLDIDLICIGKQEEIVKHVETCTFKDKLHIYDIDNDIPFDDTIHILKDIDLLITVDTFIVHLAGILNVKTWLMLGKYSEWRWSNHETSTYWYNSVELIRNKTENLVDIMPTVTEKLAKLLAERK